MKAIDLESQFSAKKRTIGDLARYIGNRTDDNSNYCLLLGAGCSVTSGIRPASALITEWRAQACADMRAPDLSSASDQIDFLKRNGSTWYDAAREYSSLFERRYDLQRQRRVFVESEVAGKVPSIGYAYLTALVEQKYFNTIFTTNFDDLLNEAFYLFSSQRPIVCAHDSSINSVTVTSKRPKVIKLHGDYLFDDLKSTVRETESLEQNMKAKLTEFSKDHGLIVVGYSGADRSIMDNLQSLLRDEEYLKSGIYWCIRRDTEIPEELRKLLFRDRVYFVEIDGFDELFGEIFSIFNPGQYVPESALGINRRSSEALQKLLIAGIGESATSPILNKARARLEKHTKRSAIAHFITKDAEDDRPLSSTDLTDDELLLLSEVSDLIVSEKYDAALERARKELVSGLRPAIRRRLLDQCISAHLAQENRRAALTVADEIIRLYPHRASSFRKKASLLLKDSEQLAELARAVEVNPFDVGTHNRIAEIKINESRQKYGDERKALLDEASESLQKALRIEPSVDNIAWLHRFELLDASSGREAEQKPMVDELFARNRYSARVLDLRRKLIEREKENTRDASLEGLLKEIDAAEERYADEGSVYARVRLSALRSMRDEDRLLRELERLRDMIERDPDLAVRAARVRREVLGDDRGAIDLLKESLRASQFDWEVLTYLIAALSECGEIDEAQKLLDKWGKRLGVRSRSKAALTILEARGRFDECLIELVDFQQKTGVRETCDEAYFLLCTNSAEAAERLLREFLDPISFTPEAAAEIVNFELARKMRGCKPDRTRLEKVLQFSSDVYVRAGAHAVLGNKTDLIIAIRDAISDDRTARFVFPRWPAMKPYMSEQSVIAALTPKSSIVIPGAARAQRR